MSMGEEVCPGGLPENEASFVNQLIKESFLLFHFGTIPEFQRLAVQF